MLFGNPINNLKMSFPSLTCLGLNKGHEERLPHNPHLLIIQFQSKMSIYNGISS